MSMRLKCQVASGLAAVLSGCYSASVADTPAAAVDSKAEELIGGFSANSSALNAVGSLAVLYYWGGMSQFCTAVLVSDNMALTAKHCADMFRYGVGTNDRVVFRIGPNAYSPAQDVDVVESEEAPGDGGGFSGYGHDIAVLHLGRRVTDVTPLGWAALDDNALGQKFVGIGYGEVDNNGYNYGTRRLGTVTLRARSGRTWEHLLGSFASFFEFRRGVPLPDRCDVGPGDDAGVSDFGGAGGMGAAVAGKGGYGGKGSYGGYGGYGGYDLCQEARDLYWDWETTRLESFSEVFVGGLPGDSQPCYGDSGGPLLRKSDSGQLQVFGLVSSGIGSRNAACDSGAIYAAFDQTVLDFLDKAKAWVDPCDGLSSVGRCDGTLAERCTTLHEGKRRRVAFDCAAVGLTCETQNDGSIGCGQDDSYVLRAEPFAPTPSGDLMSLEQHVFKQPASKP